MNANSVSLLIFARIHRAIACRCVARNRRLHRISKHYNPFSHNVKSARCTLCSHDTRALSLAFGVLSSKNAKRSLTARVKRPKSSTENSPRTVMALGVLIDRPGFGGSYKTPISITLVAGNNERGSPHYAARICN
jgi:hypothetical protein